MMNNTILGTTRPSGTFHAGTHETMTLVPTVTGTDHLGPIPLAPDEVYEFEGAGWTVRWRSCV